MRSQATFALDGYCCPHVVWAGLSTADVLRLEEPSAEPGPSNPGPERPTLASSNFQPFSERDRAVMEGLLRRPVVAEHEPLRMEAVAMQAQGRKCANTGLIQNSHTHLNTARLTSTSL